MSCLEQQSPNIADGVHVNRSEDDVGAGDQVLTNRGKKFYWKENVSKVKSIFQKKKKTLHFSVHQFKTVINYDNFCKHFLIIFHAWTFVLAKDCLFKLRLLFWIQVFCFCFDECFQLDFFSYFKHHTLNY